MSALPIGETAGAVAAVCWAGGSLLFERVGASRGVSPGTLSLGKSLFAAVVLAGMAFALHGSMLPAGAHVGDVTGLLASGVIGIAIGDTCFFFAIADLGATRAILLNSTAPLFVLLIEIATHRAFPPAKELLGVALALTGVAIVMLRAPAVLDARPRNPTRGLLLGTLAGVCQAVGSLLSRASTQGKVDPLSASWLRLAAAVVSLVIVAAMLGKLGGWVRELRKPGTFARIGAASFLGTVCGLWLAQIALAKSSSAGVAATILATTPVFAIPLAHVTGRERATARSIVGVLTAFGGIAMLTLGR